MKRRTLRWALLAALAALALGAVAFGGMASGIMPVTASSGHFAITHWLLHFAMRRSVVTHALAVDEPAYSDSWQVLKGAGHFETGCRPCHGAPDLQPPMVGRAMLPAPPWLTSRVEHWKARELFYIVKHGVKFTGMPAWPNQQRDDEVWAMVAFLQELPELDARTYRELVHGAEQAPEDPALTFVPNAGEAGDVASSCARCHGARGEGRGSAAFPKLARQNEAYQVAALEAYATGERHSGVMQTVAVGLSEKQMRELSRYYSRLPAAAEPPNAQAAERVERGRTIAMQGIAAQGVPACRECHGPAPSRRNPYYPLLAGQYADYLFLQLQLLKERRRGGSPYRHLMERVASRLEPEQMRDAAAFYESLSP